MKYVPILCGLAVIGMVTPAQADAVGDFKEEIKAAVEKGKGALKDEGMDEKKAVAALKQAMQELKAEAKEKASNSGVNGDE